MITYARHQGPTSLTAAAPLVDLYAVVYAEPPYNEGLEQVDRFRTSLLEESRRPGFTLITAKDGDTLIGASYGWIMPAGTWWSNASRPAPAEIVDAAKFAVMEWIVTPRRRGEGIGDVLIRQLLEDRPERFATLASDPRSAARGMYRRAGWIEAGETTLSWGPSMDLLLLKLPLPTSQKVGNDQARP
ncbi:GNAT family N-acetyltransferase [Couchioplanes caeruleus]|uniref:GNAT family N-acetyltransferase n=1 Tax=Couchioplanes caeruleus TaxID=56438 RepID=UPI0020BFDBDA|nr:GNAT family N-acetyltransferase [Couchioplanes caeruleus]UQU67423.1 GNAT family N-acetyltransferase [Couchioplanes caeruleus]